MKSNSEGFGFRGRSEKQNAPPSPGVPTAEDVLPSFEDQRNLEKRARDGDSHLFRKSGSTDSPVFVFPRRLTSEAIDSIPVHPEPSAAVSRHRCPEQHRN